jgi:hypothetical protein
LVESFECMMMHGLANPELKTSVGKGIHMTEK